MTCKRFLAATAMLLTVLACSPVARAQEAEPQALPAPAVDLPAATRSTQTAVLAGGCFWGVEGVFEHVRGVISVRSGYAGGTAATANYGEVSSGTTRHAEAVEIVFDPRVISYGEILRLFFSVATDPTQLNRQGPDRGPQYRSNIFPLDSGQARVAQAYIQQLNLAGVFARPIVTRVDALDRFYPAERYHQDFLARNPRHPYIVVNDLPKIAALRRLFPNSYVEARVS